MSDIAGFLFIISALFPVVGIGVTVVLSVLLEGRWCWVVLVFGPILTYIISGLLLRWVVDPNLLSVAILGILFVALALYYSVLCIVGLVHYIQSRRTKKA